MIIWIFFTIQFFVLRIFSQESCPPCKDGEKCIIYTDFKGKTVNEGCQDCSDESNPYYHTYCNSEKMYSSCEIAAQEERKSNNTGLMDGFYFMNDSAVVTVSYCYFSRLSCEDSGDCECVNPYSLTDPEYRFYHCECTAITGSCFQCNGKFGYQDETGCENEGSCVEPDTCKCTANHYGDSCEHKYSTIVAIVVSSIVFAIGTTISVITGLICGVDWKTNWITELKKKLKSLGKSRTIEDGLSSFMKLFFFFFPFIFLAFEFITCAITFIIFILIFIIGYKGDGSTYYYHYHYY